MVRNYDQTGELTGILVNTTEAYDGIRPLDFFTFQNTKEIEVIGGWKWKINVTDIFKAPFLEMPGGSTRSGDYLVILGGGIPDTAYIKKDDVMGSFRILGYGNNYRYWLTQQNR